MQIINICRHAVMSMHMINFSFSSSKHLRHKHFTYTIMVTTEIPNDLDISKQVRNLKKTTKLLSLKNMFRQKPLSSSVNRLTKRYKLNF